MTLPTLSLLTALLALPQGAAIVDGSHQTPASQAVLEVLEPADSLQVIVRFQDDLDGAAIQSLLGPRYRLGQVLYSALNIRLVSVLDRTELEASLLDLEQRRGVLYAQQDHPVRPRQTLPNDPSFGSMYGLNNTGQSGGTPDADIDAPEAWDLSTGTSDVVIAIVDGGGDTDHPDLLPNRWENPAEVNGLAGVDDDNNGYVDDLYGWDAYNQDGSIPGDYHGTHVAGTAGARGDNNLGVVGVHWNSKLMYIAGSSTQTSVVLIAYGYARDQKALWLSSGGTQGANVVVTNSSFGIDDADCGSGSYPAWNDAYDDMGAVGILSCAATANSSTDVDVAGDVPTGCSSDWLITVTSTDRNDVRSFAGYGLTTIDLAAPGVSILSTTPNGNYGTSTGTSMATPHVAGAVALLYSVASPSFLALANAQPDQAALAIKAAILDSVDPLPALSTRTVSGGRLNLHQAALQVMALDTLGATSYCFSFPNSSGQAALALAAGDSFLAANDLLLTATRLPMDQFGYFLASRGQDAVIFAGGSQGVLCVGGGWPIGRLNAQLRNSGASGEFEVPVDLTSIPTNPMVAVQAGETWNFQAWFRDQIPMNTSNFTDGVSITFQ